MTLANLSDIAERFLTARREARGLAGYPGALPGSLDEAYAIQDEAIALWNRPILGWKVGRVLPPLAERFGTDRLAGPIFAVVDGAASMPSMPIFAEGFAAGEAEFLLCIGNPPPPGQTRFTLDEAGSHIDAVHVGIEIASSPLAEINDLGPIAVVSDFGNNNGLVIGPALADWRSSGFEDWTVATLIDGHAAGSGRAAAFPDGVLGSAQFLFELLARRGIPLRSGQWISSGAVTGVHDVRPGQLIEARIDGAITVACRTIEARPE